MRKIFLFLLIIIGILCSKRAYSFDQTVQMSEGETKTISLPREVTSKNIYAGNWFVDKPSYVEIVNSSYSSVTIKAIAFNSGDIHVQFDFFYEENGNHRSDTHVINVDIYKAGQGGSSNSTTFGDDYWYWFDFDYGCQGTISIKRGQTYKASNPFYSYDINYDKIRDIKWSTKDSHGIYITYKSMSSCEIEGWREGQYKLYCYMEYGNTTYQTYYNVNVSAVQKTKVTSVNLDSKSISLKVKDKYQLNAIVLPNNATDKTVAWASDNVDVATVSNGLVTAEGLGSATITCSATDGSGVKATCSIHVENERFKAKTIEGIELLYEVMDEKAKTCKLVDKIDVLTTDTKITIPSSVNGYSVISIGYLAVNSSVKEHLTSISIPNSVTSMHQFAFSGCTKLTSVYITDLAAWCNIPFDGYRGSNPLNYAHNLYLNGNLVKDLVIPNGVISIGAHAFDGCTSISSVTIPSSVTSIGSFAFWYCTNLNSVYITDLTAWCKIQFGNSIANPLSQAHNLYLNGNLVKDLIIPSGVTSINYAAFAGCTSLTSVSTPNGVTSIGGYAFSDCTNLSSINIPSGVTSIGDNAFYGCTKLKSIVLPNGVTEIGGFAFLGCSEVTSITIPQGVTSLGKWTSYSTWENPFQSMINLKKIIVEEGNPVYDSREQCNAIIETATNRLVCGCMNTRIPQSVQAIGSHAFWISKESEFKTLVIPNNIEILEDVSINVNGLESLTIGKGVKEMHAPIYVNAPKAIRSLIEYPNNDSIYNTDDDYNKTEVVYVPKGTRSRYLASTSWSKFPNIVEANFVTDVTFENSSVDIAQGQSMQLTANITPSDADNQELEWESSDENVVIVTSTGEIVGMGIGTAVITATAKDTGATYSTCTVTVTDSKPKPISGDLNSDGTVNGTDIVLLTNMILGKTNKTSIGDVNGDGEVNGTDIVKLVNIILNK